MKTDVSDWKAARLNQAAYVDFAGINSCRVYGVGGRVFVKW